MVSTAAAVVGGVVVGGVVVGGVVVGGAVVAGVVVGARSPARLDAVVVLVPAAAPALVVGAGKAVPGAVVAPVPASLEPPHPAKSATTVVSAGSRQLARPMLATLSAYRRSMSEQRTREHRVEHDSLGDVLVPEWARWGAQTQRAVDNFPVSGLRIERSLIWALATVKGSAAVVNGRLKVLPADVAAAVHDAAAEVAAGAWDDHFPVDVFQTGSGTSSNMNANEVIAALAIGAARAAGAPERRGQRLAVVERRVPDGHPPRRHPEHRRSSSCRPSSTWPKSLRRQQRRFKGVVKAGRTHLMDATPVTLGQEFGGYASQIEHGIERMLATLPRVGELPLGGTAVGTGINAPKGFARGVIARIADRPRSAAHRGARPLRGPGRP